MSTAQLLTSLETCPRKAHWGKLWEANKLSPNQMVTASLKTSLMATGREPWGELAGSEIMQLAEDRGLDVETPRLYDSVLHHAALADVLVSAIRKPGDPPWRIPEPKDDWVSGCMLSPDGTHLRRLVLVSHWNDERHYSECRGWFSMGEIAAYELPMQMCVLVIGHMRDGKRTSPWTTGFLHPANHKLRFRKKSQSTSEVFSEKWERVYREDRAEIDRDTWLNAMLADDVLPEICFSVDIPVPPLLHLRRIREMAKAKIDRIKSFEGTPEANLSSCEWPVRCSFIKLCHILPEKQPAEKYGFVRRNSQGFGS